MGRYFLYHMHPLSIAELSGGADRAFAGDDDTEISLPSRPDPELLPRMLRFGRLPGTVSAGVDPVLQSLAPAPLRGPVSR